MPEALQAAFIGAVGALVALVVNTLLSIWRESRAAERGRRERLYGDRRGAVVALLSEGDKIQRLAMDRLAKSEYGGPMMPAEENDDERHKQWPGLRDALSLVTVLCSKTCREAADRYARTIEEYAWTGAGFEQLQAARLSFIEAAQWELEVERGPVKAPKRLSGLSHGLSADGEVADQPTLEQRG